ncbi:MAG: response regulator [Anaerolineae bacterium]|nr:response regulator [Anaerolineae bacterium]
MAANIFHGQHILLIDDNARLLRSMAFLLTVTGFEVTTAASASEALQLLEGISPHLIVADAEMSQMDGYEFLTTIRANPHFSSTPIVLTSANYELDDLMHALDLGADDFIPKPFDIYDLLDAIRRNMRVPHTQRMAG